MFLCWKLAWLLYEHYNGSLYKDWLNSLTINSNVVFLYFTFPLDQTFIIQLIDILVKTEGRNRQRNRRLYWLDVHCPTSSQFHETKSSIIFQILDHSSYSVNCLGWRTKCVAIAMLNTKTKNSSILITTNLKNTF